MAKYPRKASYALKMGVLAASLARLIFNGTSRVDTCVLLGFGVGLLLIALERVVGFPGRISGMSTSGRDIEIHWWRT